MEVVQTCSNSGLSVLNVVSNRFQGRCTITGVDEEVEVDAVKRHSYAVDKNPVSAHDRRDILHVRTRPS